MKRFRKFAYTVFLTLFFIPSMGFSQDKESKESRNQILIEAAREIMLSAGTCTLITLDEEGRPRARIMDALAPESDFTVWFGTNPETRKVKQITNDSRVTLFYRDHDDSGYVMIYGKAQMVNDPKEKEKHWKEQWEAFYKDKQKGFVLIKVSPLWMEVVSHTRGIIGDPVTWEPLKISFDQAED